MAKKSWHKKHISTKWGIAILAILLFGLVIAILQLGKNQDPRSNAAYTTDINDEKGAAKYGNQKKLMPPPEVKKTARLFIRSKNDFVDNASNCNSIRIPFTPPLEFRDFDIYLNPGGQRVSEIHFNMVYGENFYITGNDSFRLANNFELKKIKKEKDKKIIAEKIYPVYKTNPNSVSVTIVPVNKYIGGTWPKKIATIRLNPIEAKKMKGIIYFSPARVISFDNKQNILRETDLMCWLQFVPQKDFE